MFERQNVNFPKRLRYRIIIYAVVAILLSYYVVIRDNFFVIILVCEVVLEFYFVT